MNCKQPKRIFRTMWMEYPRTASLFGVDDQYLIGSDLLVKPVTAPGIVETSVKFPTDDVWYDAESLLQVSGQSGESGINEVVVPSDLDTIPVFQRGGSVIPRKLRLRRSSHLMVNDPYTLFVALDASQTATGELYMDDEVTFNHESKGDFAIATFSAQINDSSGIIQNSVEAGKGWGASAWGSNDRLIERIVIMGMRPASNISIEGESLGFTYDNEAKILVIRKPDVMATRNWEIRITF